MVIDDKDQPLDDENSGFGGNAEGNSKTVTGCWYAEVLLFRSSHSVTQEESC